jgi:hypothetical protein
MNAANDDPIAAAISVLKENDGSLADIEFDYDETPAATQAYAFIRSHAAGLVSMNNCYWSKSREDECGFGFDDDPTLALMAGDAEPFHVVFGGLRSPGGYVVPDLGVFCFTPSSLSLDYRMGPEWDAAAVTGLFEILRALSGLSERTRLAHLNNIYDRDDILLGAYRRWLMRTT